MCGALIRWRVSRQDGLHSATTATMVNNRRKLTRADRHLSHDSHAIHHSSARRAKLQLLHEDLSQKFAADCNRRTKLGRVKLAQAGTVYGIQSIQYVFSINARTESEIAHLMNLDKLSVKRTALSRTRSRRLLYKHTFVKDEFL